MSRDLKDYLIGLVVIIVTIFACCLVTYKLTSNDDKGIDIKYKELKQLQLNCLDAYVDLNKNKEIYEGLRDMWIGQEKREVKKALESIDKLVVKCVELENRKIDYILSE